jgi:hypothetical protein
MNKLIYLIPFLLFSCKEENEDVVQNLDKAGSIEVVVTTEHKTGFDVMTTVQRIWVKNQLIKTFYRVDTIPSLGFAAEYGTDSNGDEKLVTLPKDYEFFITVK